MQARLHQAHLNKTHCGNNLFLHCASTGYQHLPILAFFPFANCSRRALARKLFEGNAS